MRLRILYIPGLGDHYDVVRRLGLLTWRRDGVGVELVPMRWHDATESFGQKLDRIKTIIDADKSPVVLVGESAGGAMVIKATNEFQDHVVATITLCGMNHGAKNVNARIYDRNPAFHQAMKAADRVVATMDEQAKRKTLIIYSSQDHTVRPTNTLVSGVQSYDLRTPGHLTSIMLALKLRSELVYSFIASLP